MINRQEGIVVTKSYRHTEVQESPAVVMTYNYTHPFLSAQLCDSWRSVNAAGSRP